ncbi:hypothetical protein BJ138DRAFT_1171124 [Hygrophoropsis aurantiaca]|uniref:Uncharacterized protein n=1 Tax=Hygrophoropsis aurantiaca TaxID=72124 RepID=A0ACB8AKL7_9AGAM|nr:hypothetical protein BJ138DRAFT_1171124 [Hygrophoropsis aurantiaca]
MWEESTSSEETWSDADGGNEQGEWPVTGIVGEELTQAQSPRYEVRWDQWHRKDGTNTTWQPDMEDRRDLLSKWKRKQRYKRNIAAARDPSIKIMWDPAHDPTVHNRATDLKAQARREKLDNVEPELTSLNWDAECDRSLRCDEDPVPRLRTRRTDSAAVEGSSRSRHSPASPAVRSGNKDSKPSSSPSVRSKPLSQTASSASLRSLSKTPDRPTRASSSSSPSSSRNTRKDNFALSSRLLPPHALLEKKWRQATRNVSAASITIVNEIDDEEVPPHMEEFMYTEQKYIVGKELEFIFTLDEDLFLRCECYSSCQDATKCHCQTNSELNDTMGKNIFAYSRGLFTFRVPRGVEVIECNKASQFFCHCDANCANRVAQRPRDIAIEIFKTKHCGWGARAVEDLPKGKVMGMFTGQLVRREHIENLPDSHANYIFDLDGTEAKGEANPGDKYSVDAFECGNWTRFVNHSCEPNMKVYSVVFDTVSSMNAPYVAFVAMKYIPAQTELTIDYDPYAGEEAVSVGKSKAAPNAKPCWCGAERCRGWVKV